MPHVAWVIRLFQSWWFGWFPGSYIQGTLMSIRHLFIHFPSNFRWPIILGTCESQCRLLIAEWWCTEIPTQLSSCQEKVWFHATYVLNKWFSAFSNFSKYLIPATVLQNYPFGKHYLSSHSSLTLPLRGLILDKRQVQLFLLLRQCYNGSIKSPLGSVGHTHPNKGSWTPKVCSYH